MSGLLTTFSTFVPPGIPDEMLEDWSAPGAVTTAKNTHERIRGVIDSIEFQLKRPIVYLQGSYFNTTNIRAESDVDIVVEWWVPWSHLNETQEVNLFLDYRRVIEEALQKSIAGVKPDKKCIRIPRTSNTIPADVVPAFYTTPWNDFAFLTPNVKPSTAMKLYVPEERRWIVNYPRMHEWNGADKNKRTNGNYKPMVRVFKNAFRYAGYNCFPGYFIECLLYNVPDHCFWGPGRHKRYQDVVSWLQQAGKNHFSCQNGQMYLFGNTPEQWTLEEADKAVMCWKAIWDEYR